MHASVVAFAVLAGSPTQISMHECGCPCTQSVLSPCLWVGGGGGGVSLSSHTYSHRITRLISSVLPCSLCHGPVTGLFQASLEGLRVSSLGALLVLGDPARASAHR